MGEHGGERSAAIGNRLLLALPAETLARLLPRLQPVELVRRQPLYAPGEEAAAVYFIDRGLVSLTRSMQDGRAVEVGSVGVEGAVCLSAVLGLDRAVVEATVLLPGRALRIASAALREAAAEDAAFGDLLRRYAVCALGQLAQTAACNRLHTLNERCRRWLCVAHDSAGEDNFLITHEMLAAMLGVQRPGVTVAARALQEAGQISYANGRVRVTDRAALEAGACECYGAVRRQFDALFAGA